MLFSTLLQLLTVSNKFFAKYKVFSSFLKGFNVFNQAFKSLSQETTTINAFLYTFATQDFLHKFLAKYKVLPSFLYRFATHYAK